MMYVDDEEECPEGWEALPMPDGRILCVDPEDEEEFEAVSEAYPHALAGDMEEFRRLTNI